jgi:NADPH:quinone reductase-like Zn-dependent oxidoreductase
MLAAVRDRYGSPDVVRLEEVETPVPTGDRILVRVRAASVNRGDLDQLGPRPGFLRLFVGLRRPRQHRLGIDVAGVVDAVGPDVTRFKPGDEVFADLFPAGFGSFAEYVCARETLFQPKPPSLSFEEAACLPHGAILALQGLRLRDGRTLAPGDRVLIGGASGSVGPFAVQIAKSLGAHVTGVARGEKLDLVRSLGADRVIDYTQVDYTATGDRYDWILETDAHHSMLRVRRALRPGGVYLTLGGDDRALFDALLIGPVITLASDKRVGLMLWWKPFHADDVARLTQLVEAGTVRPVIDRTYPLTRLVEALHWVDDGHARGKVVVLP